MTFLFEVDYHNMINFGNRGFSIDNLHFEPISRIYDPSNFWSLGTGKLIITIPETIKTIDEAQNYFKSIIQKLSIILSFCAHGHVYFGKYDCFEIVDHKKAWKLGSYFSGRTGSPSEIWIIQRHPQCLEDFVSSVFPLLNDEEYCQKKGILDAISYVYEGYCFLQKAAFQIRYLAFWTAFEILLHKYFESNPKNFVLDLEEESRNMKKNAFFDDFERLVKNHGFTSFENELLSPLHDVFNNISIRKRIRYFLEQTGFDRYKGVVVKDKYSMYDLRSEISHGRTLKYEPIKVELFAKLMRLVDKVILKTLNYYENKKDCIHPAYLNDDLLAT